MAKNKTVAGKTKSGKPSRKPPTENVSGAPFNEQDPKRRLGNYTGAGEHARQGGRGTGIVGQTKQRNRTDKRGKK